MSKTLQPSARVLLLFGFVLGLGQIFGSRPATDASPKSKIPPAFSTFFLKYGLYRRGKRGATSRLGYCQIRDSGLYSTDKNEEPFPPF